MTRIAFALLAVLAGCGDAAPDGQSSAGRRPNAAMLPRDTLAGLRLGMTAAEVRAAWQSAGRMLWCAAEGPDAICSNGDAAAHEGMIIVGFRGGELVRINRVLGPEFSAVLPAEFVDRQQPFGPPDRQAAGGEYSATWRSDSSERRVTCPEGARDASVCSISVVRTPE